jgi:hypothetical protein
MKDNNITSSDRIAAGDELLVCDAGEPRAASGPRRGARHKPPRRPACAPACLPRSSPWHGLDAAGGGRRLRRLRHAPGIPVRRRRLCDSHLPPAHLPGALHLRGRRHAHLPPGERAARRGGRRGGRSQALRQPLPGWAGRAQPLRMRRQQRRAASQQPHPPLFAPPRSPRGRPAPRRAPTSARSGWTAAMAPAASSPPSHSTTARPGW